MKVLTFPQEPIPENRNPLNRAAKKALKQAGEYPDPYFLYCLQLALWALNGKFLANGQELELTVGSMLGRKPDRVMKIFEKAVNGEPMDLMDPQKKYNPEDLAALVLGEVEARLSLFTDYPTLSKV